MAITCIPRGGRLVAGDRGVGDRNIAGVKVDIDAAAVAGGCRVAGDGAAVHGEAALLTHIHAAATAVRRTRSVIGNGSAMHGESWRVGLIRRADKEHTAAGAAACFITGNLSTIHGKGRAGLIGAALYTDLHAAGDRAAVQFKFAAVDGHFALNPAAADAVGQRQRRAAADGDFAVDRLPVQAEVDLAHRHSPAPRHRLRQIIAARSTGQGIGCRPCCAGVMGSMTVDRCTAVLTADTVVRMGSFLYRRRLRQRGADSLIARQVYLGQLLRSQCLQRCVDGSQLLRHRLRVLCRHLVRQGIDQLLYRRHCGIRFAVLRLAAAVGIAAVRAVRHAAIFAASQPGILTGGVSAVGICGVLHHACFLRQCCRWQHGEAERECQK